MTIKPTPVPNRRKPNGFWLRTFMEFLEGEADCVELIPDDQEYKSIRSLQCSVSSAIHRYNLAISTANRDGKLYLVKKVRKDSNDV